MAGRSSRWGVLFLVLISGSAWAQVALIPDGRSGFNMGAQAAVASDEYVLGATGSLSYQSSVGLDFATDHTVASTDGYSALEHADFNFSTFVIRAHASPWQIRSGSAIGRPGVLIGYEYQNYGEQFQQPDDYLSARDSTIKYLHTGVTAHLQQTLGDYLLVPQIELSFLLGQNGATDVTRVDVSCDILIPTSIGNALSFGLFYQATDQRERPNIVGVRIAFHGWEKNQAATDDRP